MSCNQHHSDDRELVHLEQAYEQGKKECKLHEVFARNLNSKLNEIGVKGIPLYRRRFEESAAQDESTVHAIELTEIEPSLYGYVRRIYPHPSEPNGEDADFKLFLGVDNSSVFSITTKATVLLPQSTDPGYIEDLDANPPSYQILGTEAGQALYNEFPYKFEVSQDQPDKLKAE